MTTSGTTSDNKWYNEWQRVAQQVTTSGTTSDNEWQRITASGTTSDNKWQWVTPSDSSGTMNENAIVYFKEWMIAIAFKNRYTTTSRDGWLQLEWFNK